jgi:hypothetical protein
MTLKITIFLICLLLTGCQKQVIVIIHNHTDQTIFIKSDKNYTIRPNETARTRPPINQIITINIEGSNESRYKLILPSPHTNYIEYKNSEIILQAAFLSDKKLYALQINKDESSQKSQPKGFPLSPE